MTDTTKTTAATTAPKRNPSITTEVRNGCLVVSFPKLGDEYTMVVDPVLLRNEIVNQAMLHGLKQKLVDAAAIARNPANGASATDLDKYNAIREVYERITSPNPSWNAVERGGSDSSLLFQALCLLQPKAAPEAVRAWLDGKPEAEQKALAKNPQVITMIATIRAERAKAAGADAGALMSELAGLGGVAEADVADTSEADDGRSTRHYPSLEGDDNRE